MARTKTSAVISEAMREATSLDIVLAELEKRGLGDGLSAGKLRQQRRKALEKSAEGRRQLVGEELET